MAALSARTFYSHAWNSHDRPYLDHNLQPLALKLKLQARELLPRA